MSKHIGHHLDGALFNVLQSYAETVAINGLHPYLKGNPKGTRKEFANATANVGYAKDSLAFMYGCARSGPGEARELIRVMWLLFRYGVGVKK